MSRPTVVDYSWAKPDPACLRANGYVGVMRYLSWDRTGKNLTREEATRLHAAGLWIGLNWEQSGNWAEFAGGYGAGERNGIEAARQANALGAPASVPIFVSADYGAPRDHWETIDAYLRGFNAGSGRRVGFYGQGNLADWLLDRGVIGWIWQTNATAWGGVSRRAVLTQHIWTDICGASCDPNTLNHDATAWVWTPHQTSTPPPTPKDDDMTPDEKRKQDETLAAATEANKHAGQIRLLDVPALTDRIGKVEDIALEANGNAAASLMFLRVIAEHLDVDLPDGLKAKA